MFKQRLFEILEKAEDGDTASFVFDVTMITLIILNVVIATAESFNSFAEKHAVFLRWFEVFSIVVFSIEYLLRVYTATQKYKDSKLPRLRYIVSAEALIDLAAIMPFYLPFVKVLDLRFLRIFRVLKIMRIFKLGRYSEAMIMIGKVLNKEKERLISTVFLTVIMIFVASTIMYYMENSAQPDIFPNILQTTWWAISTFTTIWYGDVCPITIPGKICGGIISLLGIMIIALPSGIICSGFIDEINNSKKQQISCPHCGKEFLRD
jgi:voltage-gated potassium channel